jgi:hypothetical protein
MSTQEAPYSGAGQSLSNSHPGYEKPGSKVNVLAHSMHSSSTMQGVKGQMHRKKCSACRTGQRQSTVLVDAVLQECSQTPNKVLS